MKPRASHIDPCSSDPMRLASLLSGVFVMICLLLLFLWLKFHTEIAETIVLIQDTELTFISLFTHQYDVMRNNLHQAIPERISPGTLWTLCTITGSVLQWPVCVFLLILAFSCTKHALSELYCKQFRLDGLKVALAWIHSIGTAWSGNQQTLVEPSPPEKPLRPMDPALKMEEWMNRHAIGSTEKEKKEAVRQALIAYQTCT